LRQNPINARKGITTLFKVTGVVGEVGVRILLMPVRALRLLVTAIVAVSHCFRQNPINARKGITTRSGALDDFLIVWVRILLMPVRALRHHAVNVPRLVCLGVRILLMPVRALRRQRSLLLANPVILSESY